MSYYMLLPIVPQKFRWEPGVGSGLSFHVFFFFFFFFWVETGLPKPFRVGPVALLELAGLGAQLERNP